MLAVCHHRLQVSSIFMSMATSFFYIYIDIYIDIYFDIYIDIYITFTN